MAHEKVYATCENMCLEETMTKEDIENILNTMNTEINTIKTDTNNLKVNKQNTIGFGTSLPVTSTDGDIFLLYEE